MRSPLRPPVAIAVLLALAACSETGEVSAPPEFPLALDLVSAPTAFCGAATVTPLIADETVNVGTVRVVNDEDFLYVTYSTDGPWPISKTALFVGPSAAAIPTNGPGNPRVGQFQNKSTHRPARHEVTYRVPIEDAGAETAVIAAFAEVGEEPEGAWGAGSMIRPGGSWATYFTHDIQSCGTLIDPDAGGTATFGDLVELVVPQGSIDQPAVITIEPSTRTVSQAISGTVFDFGPEGLQFDPPAKLTIAYDPAALPSGVPENALRGFIINGIFEVFNFPAIDQNANTVTFDVEHFSTYGVTVLEGDLAVDVGADPNPARLSDEITLSFEVSNTAATSQTIENAVVMITLAGQPFIRSSTASQCTQDGQIGSNGEIFLFCNTGPLGPGDLAHFEIVGHPFAGTGAGTLLVEAVVLQDATYGYVDSVPGNDADVEVIEIFPDVSADLRMKAFGPGPARQAGLESSVSATVESLGTSLDPVDASIQFLFSDAGAVGLEVLTDQLPAGCSVAQGSSSTSITCDVGTLAPGDEAMRTVHVRPLQVKTYAVSATGYPVTDDPTPANNTQSGSFQATATNADLRAAIVANQTTVDAGDPVTFSAIAENLSGDLVPSGALRIEVEGDVTLQQPPAGCDLVEVFPFDLAWNCAFTQVDAGQNSGVFDFVLNGTTPGGEIVAHARLLLPSYVTDTNSANDTDDVVVTVNPDVQFDLRMRGFGPGPSRQAGLLRTVSAILENKATAVDPVDASIQFVFSDAGAVGLEVIADQLPAGCTFVQGSSSTTVTCAVGSLAPGTEVMREIVVRPLQVKTYSVSAVGLPLTDDPTPADNDQIGAFQSTATNTDMAAAIVVNHTSVAIGESVIFSAQAQNLGPDLLPFGTLRIELEGDATLVDGDAGCTPVDVFPYTLAFNCPLSEIPAGQYSTVFNITVQGGTGGADLVGHARLLLPSYVTDGTPANNTDDATTSVLSDNTVDYQLDPLAVSATTVKAFEPVTFQGLPELVAASSPPVAGGSYVITLLGDLSFESVTEASCSVSALALNAGYEMTCPLVSMVVGEVKAFGITVSANTAPGSINATARVVPPADAQEQVPADNEQTAQVTVNPLVADANLSLILDTPDPVDAGEVVTYEVYAQSATGSDDLPSVSVRFLVNGDVELVSMPTGIGITCQSVATSLADLAVLCDIADHQPQNARHLTYEVRALSGPTVDVEGEIFIVQSYATDPDPSNNVRNAQTTVTPAAPQPTGTLLFSSDRAATNFQLFTKDLSTSTITRIVDSPALAEAQWSADGTRIAAMWGQRLAIADADGSNVVLYNTLDYGIVGTGSPSWSPDGTKIVLQGILDVGEQDVELFVFDLASETFTPLTDNSVNDEFPSWSPDGTSIAYTVDRTALYTIEPNGANPLPMLTGTSVLHPDWSPDGSRLAFTQIQATGSSIAVMDAGNPASLVTLENDGRGNVKPAWSPDGTFVAFAKDWEFDDAYFDLYYILADGTGSAQVLEAILNFSTFDVDWK